MYSLLSTGTNYKVCAKKFSYVISSENIVNVLVNNWIQYKAYAAGEFLPTTVHQSQVFGINVWHC